MSIHKISQLIVLSVAVISLTGALPAAVAAPAGDNHSTAYMGVMVDTVPPDVANALHLKDGSGAAITGVDQDGPACLAGLKKGDVVVVFNGKPVEGSSQLAGLIHSSAPGTTISLTVARDGQSKEMKVTLGDWKQMAGMPKPQLRCREWRSLRRWHRFRHACIPTSICRVTHRYRHGTESWWSP